MDFVKIMQAGLFLFIAALMVQEAQPHPIKKGPIGVKVAKESIVRDKFHDKPLLRETGVIGGTMVIGEDAFKRSVVVGPGQPEIPCPFPEHHNMNIPWIPPLPPFRLQPGERIYPSPYPEYTPDHFMDRRTLPIGPPIGLGYPYPGYQLPVPSPLELVESEMAYPYPYVGQHFIDF